jgi:hypothetical protein
LGENAFSEFFLSNNLSPYRVKAFSYPPHHYHTADF